MSEKRRDGKKRDDKRRDTKGRVLRNGESQEKDGRYTYKYTDAIQILQVISIRYKLI